MSRLVLLCCLPGCVLVVDGDGAPVTEVREVGPFSALRNDSFVDVTLQPGATGEATLRCDPRLLDRLVVEVVDDELVVRRTRGWTVGVVGPCTLEASTDALTAAAVSGSGRVEVRGVWEGFEDADVSGSGGLWLEEVRGAEVALRLSGSGALEVGWVEADEVRADLSGSGAASAAGRADRLVLDVSGSGAADLDDLGVVDADVRVSGSGTARVFATGTVTGALTGSGDVVVQGGAEVDVSVSGSGRVVVD